MALCGFSFEHQLSRIPGRASARSRATRSRPLASRTRSQIGARARRAWATRGGSNSNGSASLEKSRHLIRARFEGTWVTRPEATQAQVRPRAISRRGISREALSERDSRRARPSATFRACGVARGAQISVTRKDRSGVWNPRSSSDRARFERRAPVSRFLPTTPRTTERLTAATDRRLANTRLAPPASRARLTQAAEPNARA